MPRYHHRPHHGHRAGPPRRQLRPLRRAHPPRRRPARRRAGRHPRAAHAGCARRGAPRPGGPAGGRRAGDGEHRHAGADLAGDGRRPRPRAGTPRTSSWCSGGRSPRGRSGRSRGRSADVGANIDAIRRVADYPVTGLELLVSPVPGQGSEDYPPGTLRKKLVDVARAAGVDVAVERAGLARRSKRLIVFDVDSTLVQGEVIEMLAARAGTEDEVRAVTEAAMRGELDFADVAARPRRDAGRAARVGARRRRPASWSSPRARAPRSARSSGSGSAAGSCPAGSPGSSRGWSTSSRWTSSPPTSSRSSTAGSPDGWSATSSTGRARRSRWSGSREEVGVPLDQCVAVGDGANDIDMLSTAGLGIAFNAKPALRRDRRHRAVGARTWTSCCSSWASPATRSSAPTPPTALRRRVPIA